MALSRVVLALWIYSSWLGVCWSAGPSVKSPVYVQEGEAAELSCTYLTKGDPKFTLEWRYAPPGVPAIQAKDVLYYDGQLYKQQLWDSRMSLLQYPPSNGVASLRIQKVRLSDAGIYICDVKTPSDWTNSGRGLINLTVLTPPSWPVCQLTGKTYVGNDVTLQCQSATGNPRPIYAWSRTNHQVLPQNAVTDQISGSLVLRNLSISLAGTYTCTASNEYGRTACSLTISVSYVGTAGVVGGAVMGVFLVLLLLGALVACFLWRRKRRSSNKLQNGQRQVNGDPAEVYLTGTSESPRSKLPQDSKDPPGLKGSQFSPLV
ncbi:V-set and immunoglobulin domain-containing protein 2-like [Alosa sapidissima]|uniref:V-set and immunoglobulin domain-containing protein 2-like n=1 Tax=Alosa sapidissima TaxID=34773 RepID=UPI001C07FE93|nr:V-set and immunoglobulin domain-containing protein 2-like [Alosa sapidissima]